MAITQAGAKFYIAVDATTMEAEQHSDDLTLTGFQALTWLEVKGVGSVGQTGIETNMVTYDELATDVTQKGKGISNAGDPEVEVRRIDTDAGQIEMRRAAQTRVGYAFKYELDNSAGVNGTTFYNRGLVAGPTRPNGGNEDFNLETYTLGLNQREVIEEAS